MIYPIVYCTGLGAITTENRNVIWCSCKVTDDRGRRWNESRKKNPQPDEQPV